MVKKSTNAIYILLEPLHHNVNIPIVALCMPYFSNMSCLTKSRTYVFEPEKLVQFCNQDLRNKPKPRLRIAITILSTKMKLNQQEEESF